MEPGCRMEMRTRETEQVGGGVITLVKRLMKQSQQPYRRVNERKSQPRG